MATGLYQSPKALPPPLPIHRLRRHRHIPHKRRLPGRTRHMIRHAGMPMPASSISATRPAIGPRTSSNRATIRARGGRRHKGRVRSIHLSAPAALVRAPAAGDDGEDEEATDRGRHGDDDGFVAVDPGFDFVCDGGAVASALGYGLANVLKRTRIYERNRGTEELTFWHLPPAPQGVPSRKFCRRP
jgi:hypothetical protein